MNNQDFEATLYDCKVRDAERQIFIKQNQEVFLLIFKVIITVSSISLGSTALSTLPEKAHLTCLWLAWALLVLSIALISAELIVSHYVRNKYIAVLGKTYDFVPIPKNYAIYVLMISSVVSMILGLIFLIISVAVGNHNATSYATSANSYTIPIPVIQIGSSSMIHMSNSVQNNTNYIPQTNMPKHGPLIVIAQSSGKTCAQ